MTTKVPATQQFKETTYRLIQYKGIMIQKMVAIADTLISEIYLFLKVDSL